MKMRLSFIALMGSLLVLSCTSGEDQTGGEQKEYFTDDAAISDSTDIHAVFLTDTLKDSLALYFSSDLITEIETYLTHFNVADTDTAFEKSYQEGIALLASFDDAFKNPQTAHVKKQLPEGEWDIFPIYQELQQFNGKLGPLYFGCAAECTMLDFFYDLTILHEKSKRTIGKSDDAFMHLLMAVEGDYGYAGFLDFKVWDIQYWDYGGSHRLGDGIMLNVVNLLIDYKKKYTLFADVIALIHADVFETLAAPHAYEFSVEEVLAEYTKIFKLNYFEGEELKAIRAQYDHIKAHSEEYQFNCEEGNCTFG
ncbi:MAG: hypothetical protein HYZ14_15475 [Bacteroidetes bacterium]|nr:hypothetical protein [Bacteroidota bacterium]